MGMNVSATVCIGAVIYGEDLDINSNVEDILEKIDDMITWDDPIYEVEYAVAEGCREYILCRKDSKISSEWTTCQIKSNFENLEAKICFLKQVLKKNKLNYGEIGILLFPYFDH